uniref:DsbA family oxidoreductase n=1 Tax=Polynucleobacter sp. TaxID=2029855 RepID=UPI00404800E3
MKPIITIDFVSDIACPWCAVGFGNLSQAVSQLEMVADFKVHFRAFQLNPHMPPGGQDAMEHLTQKYGLSLDQVKTNQAQISARALEAGFVFHPEGRKRVYNTFKCHRLLYWAANEGDLDKQAALKKELLNTYFCLAVSLDDEKNILDAVARAGLDKVRAREILSGAEFITEVKAEEEFYKGMGIQSVPSMILNEEYLLQGAQEPESLISAFEQLIM